MPANETGLPGISLPACLDRDGLPIGVQFYGNFCREDLLLQIAAQIERAEDAAKLNVPKIGKPFDVCAGPNRTGGVVQHFERY